ncbi:hypothetical protein Poli38472_009159 [Pythium oligandrum]|uniref:HECT-type E3 ubiquitin transferase n=1 Tax=Pythium oligandrum TaxID=41045 RepID=A0A8K1CMC8_PYTOL|nr:hypothetical protein Poli38472_009159 [Pythium oligandrum]|eukprot:TMW64992.1 hypothetical protein Poli38472_009159 [Pythium oligandrum]
MADAEVAGASMEIFLALMAVVMLLLLVGGLYLLKERSSGSTDALSRSFLARILLTENETITRLDLERNGEAEERWKCLVCEFTNSMDKANCILCGTKRNSSRRTASEAEEQRIKRSQRPSQSTERPSQSYYSHSASLSQLNLRLSVLNPRQRYARKRKEWVRKIAPDGSAYWIRQDIVYSSSHLQNQPQPPVRTPSFSSPSHEGTSFTSASALCRPSSGFVTYLVRSSVHSEGRLTFAESTKADAATTITGYRIHADVLELIDHVSQLPFQKKYAWFLERMSGLLKSWDEGRIKLSVHRENILVESMEQLLGIQHEHLHYPLRIEFIGEVGIDAGGLQREWFSILFEKLLDDSLGLFMNCHRNNQSVAINPNSIDCTADHLLYFRGIGRLIGRALLEGSTMQARLCLPILKHFLGVPITFSDLQYVDPEVYNSMKWIRENDNVDALDLTFSVTEIRDERPLVIDLLPNGQDICVTDANKAEYLHLKLRYLMLDRYAEQLQALSQGLFEVIPQENLMVFDYQELELVLCGLPEIDLADWKRNTHISSSLSDSPVVGWFWEVLGHLSEDERARFLQYSTGSSRVPVQGFKGLTSYDGRICPFSIRPLPNQTRGFPKVHTCFNRVELPQYATKMELEEAIYAILEMELNEFSEE